MESFIVKRDSYINALQRLEELLHDDINDVIIDATIQRFEFTFELAWKTVKEYLELNGFVEGINSPKGTLQTAFKEGIIIEGDIWIKMMEARNLTAHLYDYDTSRNIYDMIKNEYIRILRDLKKRLEMIN